MMQTFDNLTEAQRDQLAKLAEARGTTAERLIAAVMRRDKLDREAARTEAPNPLVERKHTAARFHIGESAVGIRRR